MYSLLKVYVRVTFQIKSLSAGISVLRDLLMREETESGKFFLSRETVSDT